MHDAAPPVQSRGSERRANQLACALVLVYERFDHNVWVQRSGGYLVFATRLLSEFPEGELLPLARFIGPSQEYDAWIRDASAIPRQTPSGSARLDPEVRAAITQARRPGLQQLGYPL